MPKPIRVFYSSLSNRFYASRAYKEQKNGCVTITGQKFDVTSDIDYAVKKHGINFTKITGQPLTPNRGHHD